MTGSENNAGDAAVGVPVQKKSAGDKLMEASAKPSYVNMTMLLISLVFI